MAPYARSDRLTGELDPFPLASRSETKWLDDVEETVDDRVRPMYLFTEISV